MITISAKDLSETLKPLARIAALTEREDDAGFIELQPLEQGCIAHAGSFSSYMRLPIDATVESTDPIRIHARTAKQILGDASATDVMRLTPDKGFVQWQGTGGRYRIRGHHAPLKYLLPELGAAESSIALPCDALAAALHRIQPFVPKMDARPAFTNGLLRITPDAIVLAATDGRRLIEHRIPSKTQLAEHPLSALIPRDALAHMADFLASHRNAHMTLHDQRLVLTAGDALLALTLTKGQFPPYEQLFPEPGSTPIEVNSELLGTTVRNYATVADDDAVPRLSMRFAANEIHCYIQAGNQSGSAEGAIAARYAGEPFEVAVSPVYLRAALDAFEDMDVAIHHAGDPRAPLLLTAQSQPGTRVVLMPMR